MQRDFEALSQSQKAAVERLCQNCSEAETVMNLYLVMGKDEAQTRRALR
jgi:hypothetical protein